jgi:HPt (histidine-containing phosphotransfer) domain-containing protein
VRELAQLFLIEGPKHLNAIREAIREGNAKALEYSAHALKGSVGNFSAKGAYETAARLEAIALCDDLAAAPEILKILESQLVEFNEVLLRMTKEALTLRS